MKSIADHDVLAQAIAHHEVGRLDVAEHLYRAVLALNDGQAEANHHLGVLEIERGHLDIGLTHLQRALEISPETGQYWQSFAEALMLAQRPEDAMIVIEQALANGLDTAAAHDLQRRITHRSELIDQACTTHETCPALEPPNSSENQIPDFVTFSPLKFESQGQTGQNRLLDLLKQGKFAQARRLARQLTETDPEIALGWKVLGTLLVHEDDSPAALPVLEQARRLAPEDAEILNSLGQAYESLERLDDAVDIYRNALVLQPNLAGVWYNQGKLQQQLGRLEDALASYDQAVRLQPDYAKAHNNRGMTLRELDRQEEALACYERVLKIQPDSAEALNNRGLALQDLGRIDDALVSFDAALALKPDHAAPLTNRGNVLKDQGRLDEALASYRQAVKIQPDLVEPWHNRLLCLNYQANLSRDQVFVEHLAFECHQAAKVKRLPPFTITDRDPDRRLRIGLVSGDFRLHSVAFFLLPVLEQIDRRQFQVYCYVTSSRRDNLTRSFRELTDCWVEHAGMGHDALAGRIRQDGIDLLLDLSGHTDGNALLAFAARPAPVQITWLGYPNTTGLNAMDYRLVDALTDPVGEADDYHSECLIRLPSGFLCYRPLESNKAPPIAAAPCVESGRITFGSFNNFAKLTPVTVDLWGRVLRAVPDARLLLKSHTIDDIRVWDRLVADFAEHGIDPQRLKILPRASSYLEHLSQYQHLDIALDTFPYHGTTTTCEALFMGVPVVTLAGDRHASRVGASLLTQVDLPELIATTPDDYIDIAHSLAVDQRHLTELHTGLRERLEHSPLRDEVGFTRTLEMALRQMWRIWCAGKEPRAFEMSPPAMPESGQQNSVTPSPVAYAKQATKKQKKTRTKGRFDALRQLKSRFKLKDSHQDSPTVAEQNAIITLFNLERYSEAEVAARKLIERYPDAMFGWKAIGTILIKTNQHQAALPMLLEAIRLSPREEECIHNLGYALLSLGRLDEAMTCFRRTLEIYPDYILALNNLGTTYKDLGCLDKAMEYYDHALEIDPDYAEAHCNKGAALEELGRLDEAVACYIKALALQPIYAQAQNNLGNIYKNQGCLDDALTCYRRALEIKPDMTTAFQNLLLCLNYRTDLSRQQIFTEHQSFAQRYAVSPLTPVAMRERNPDQVLRLGFVSGDLRLHSVAFFLLPVFEHLNRRQFRIFCYSRSHRKDEVTDVFRRLSDEWIDCPGLQGTALAERIQADGIDVLFDLSGHTSPNALLAFTAKPAPVQISWIGYPNTTGLTAMDYRLVDAVTDPVGDSDIYHSEHLIRLPTGFLCYRPWKSGLELPVSLPPFLENGRITFGSFNSLAKITQATQDLWVEVMQAVPEARLLLKSHTTTDIQIWDRLVAHFTELGIVAERLEILPRAPSYAEHLAQYQHLDIALDTFPYHGTTTTCEALFMGVPVITLIGDRHAARVGASLLTHVGLPEFIAQSALEYVQIARNLAYDPERLARLRRGLRERQAHSPLCDEVGFTRTLELALRQMWRIWCAGESPRVFNVIPHHSGEDGNPQLLLNASSAFLADGHEADAFPAVEQLQPQVKKNICHRP